jgi:hypothetical protein
MGWFRRREHGRPKFNAGNQQIPKFSRERCP